MKKLLLILIIDYLDENNLGYFFKFIINKNVIYIGILLRQNSDLK